MELHELYKQSDIFASINDVLGEHEHTDFSTILTDFQYLNNKNKAFDLFKDPDLYLIINFQNGEIVFEKNNRLEIGGFKMGLSQILELVDIESLKIDAKIDKAFIDFHIQNNAQALDLLLSSKTELTFGVHNKHYIERNISVLSNDKNGIPLFGFSCINLIEVGNYPIGNYAIRSTSNNIKLVEQLKNEINGVIK